MKNSLVALGVLLGVTLIACGNVERKDADHAGESTAAALENTDQPAGVSTEKPGAPVVIEGQIQPGKATLKVGFIADANDVQIEVWGVDGLVVSSSTVLSGGQPVSQARFARGEYVTVDVSFTAPQAVRSNLAIRVRGLFGSQVRERVQSFTVNADAPPATTAPGEVRSGPDGSPVRVMRAN